MSLVNPSYLPGIDAAVETTEVEFLWGDLTFARVVGVVLDSAAIDSGNTPTTTLRRGLPLGKVTSSGKMSDYDPTQTDGSQEPIGLLYTSQNLLDLKLGTVRDVGSQMVIQGGVKVAQLPATFDEYCRRALSPRFIFDDFRQLRGGFNGPTAKAASYTVLSTDNDRHFTTAGASGAVVFTLPTPAKGYRFRFTNVVDQNMTITAPANKFVLFNNATATSLAFSTSGNKIGANVEVVANDDGTKYIAFLGCTNTATVS